MSSASAQRLSNAILEPSIWDSFWQPGTPFESNFAAPELSWTRLWPLWPPYREKVSFKHNLGVYFECYVDPQISKKHKEPTKVTPGKVADKKSISDPSPSGPMWFPQHKYHMFWRVHPCAFEWLWGHFRAPSGVTFWLFWALRAVLEKLETRRNLQVFRDLHPAGSQGPGNQVSRDGGELGPRRPCSQVPDYM